MPTHVVRAGLWELFPAPRNVTRNELNLMFVSDMPLQILQTTETGGSRASMANEPTRLHVGVRAAKIRFLLRRDVVPNMSAQTRAVVYSMIWLGSRGRVWLWRLMTVSEDINGTVNSRRLNIAAPLNF